MNFTPQFSFARTLALSAALGFGFTYPASAQTSVTTVPVGAVTVTIAAGPATTSIGFPLNPDSVYSGKISGVASSTLSFLGTPFLGANLSDASSPFYIRIKTGAQQGRVLKITANTDNALSLDLTDDTPNSVSLDISGSAVSIDDAIEVFPADTLASFFGTGSGLSLNAGTSGFNSDTVSFWNGVKYEAYFFNSTLGYWSKVGYAGNFNNKVMTPNDGVLIKRKTGAPSTSITVTGSVPMHRVLIRHAGNSGSKLVVSPFPVDMAMSSMLFNALNPLLSGTSFFNSDTVSTWNGAKWTAYYKNSTSGKWLQNGNTSTDFSTQSIQAGVPVAVFRRNAKIGMANFIGLDRPYPDPTLN